MNKIFQHTYVTCFQSEDAHFFEIRWRAKSEFADEIEIMELTQEMLSNVPKLDLVLVDARQMYFAISPSFQIEYGRYSTQKFLELGCKKLAVLLPDELIAQLGLQQLVDEVDNMEFENVFQTVCFANIEEAKKWLGTFE